MPFEKAAAFTLRKMNIVCDLRQGNRFGIGGLDEREKCLSGGRWNQRRQAL